MSDRGELAIVLHTHMPYVEGFGTWPFGEEWLWEAMASCYLPLLDLLDAGAPLTLSLTPVLCDQLEAPGIAQRFAEFVREVRSFTYREDARGLREAGEDELARELERALGLYEVALELLAARGGELLPAFARHASWTSSATHAILPLLASDALVRAQLRTGIRSHLARFGDEWRGGFWLPECAHSPALDWELARAGVRKTCVELTGRFGLGAAEHLRPLLTDAGVLLVPIDRASIALAWSDSGYPAHDHYRDSHRRTVHNHNPWANDGGAYDHGRAMRLAREHACDFVGRIKERLREHGRGLPGGGLVVFAVDTEFFGHWWYEGLAWLAAVVEQCERQGLALVHLDDAAALRDPAESRDGAPAWQPSSWGDGGDLSTWSGSRVDGVAEMAFQTRAAELGLLRAGRDTGAAALRELLALQASDWAFMVSRGLAVPYAHERFDGHLAALERSLQAGAGTSSAVVRNLAVHADLPDLFEP
jgi:1,4-alpha-glucan branching enzyme